MDFDAVLLLSFGGPEGPEQVRPFLENVTRGRDVPAERLDHVAQHYLHFGGVSPINQINRALIAQLRAELVQRGLDLPVYFGNRNWEHYVEDIARARRAAGPDAPELVKLRPYFDHPGFVQIFADTIGAAAGAVPAELSTEARVVFTAHSIPVAADQRCGPQLYSRQVAYAARLVAAAAGYRDFDLVWQSRSGPPQVPWLEPDVADHLSALAATGTKAVIICPIGFVADHIEVVWDLDQELRSQADLARVTLTRASTPNAHPRFARLAVDLIDELRYGRAPARVSGPDPVPGCAARINGEPCRPPHCVAEERPA